MKPKTKNIRAYFVELQIGNGKKRDFDETVILKHFPAFVKNARAQAVEYALALDISVNCKRVRVYVVTNTFRPKEYNPIYQERATLVAESRP